jgi:hypothetical protein
MQLLRWKSWSFHSYSKDIIVIQILVLLIKVKIKSKILLIIYQSLKLFSNMDMILFNVKMKKLLKRFYIVDLNMIKEIIIFIWNALSTTIYFDLSPKYYAHTDCCDYRKLLPKECVMSCVDIYLFIFEFFLIV